MNDDAILRAALEPARTLQPTEAEVARALARARRRPAWRGRTVLVALLATAALGGTAYAVTPIRGALGTFAGWVAGDDAAAPGRAARPDDNAPAWLAANRPRVIAEAGGAKLYVAREKNGYLSFGLGDSIGESGPVASFKQLFADHDLVLLGPGGFKVNQPFDDQWRRPLYGITSRLVTRVELTYASGPSTVADGLDGGFVLLGDAKRPLRDLIAYDSAGRELERKDVSKIELRVCREVRGCPPGKYEPQR